MSIDFTGVPVFVWIFVALWLGGHALAGLVVAYVDLRRMEHFTGPAVREDR